MNRPDPAEFRHAVARFPTGVTVITTLDGAGDKIGMTANTFTSVSLAPPTVLISIMNGRTLNAIRQLGAFAVNILPSDGEELSTHFAGCQIPGLTPAFENTDGMPKLENAIAYFDCNVSQIVEVADHMLLIGSVQACCHQDQADPLVYFSSQYRALGN